jgi:hypothetical protein
MLLAAMIFGFCFLIICAYFQAQGEETKSDLEAERHCYLEDYFDF